jgi:hypothetical protein
VKVAVDGDTTALQGGSPSSSSSFSVDLLKLLVHLGDGVRVRPARRFGPELILQERVEIAVDAGGVDADTLLAGDRDQIDVLFDVARRVGIGDVPGNDQSACWVVVTPANAADNAWERPIALAVRAAHDTAAPKAAGIRAKITGAKIAGDKITGSLAASSGSFDPKSS